MRISGIGRSTPAVGMRPWIDKEIICWSRLENETLLLNLVTGFYYTLDELGGEIWSLLLDGKSPAEISADIEKNYDVPKNVIDQDLKELLDLLQTEGLLTFK